MRLASAIVGLAICFALPVFLPWWSKPMCSAMTLFASALPFVRALFPARTSAPHTASGRAVELLPSGALACTREVYAREIAARAGVGCQERPRSRAASPFDLALLLLPALVLSPLSHSYQHPGVRVLNLADLPGDFFVDGKRLARVEPSSGESPFAGVELNVPSGTRTFLLRDLEGKVIDSTVVDVRAGAHHLYAPASDETCFWLETRGYGRAATKTSYEPLFGQDRFWVIPEDVRGWFLPGSEATPSTRATGGSARVLRQAACVDAPFAH